MRPTWYKLVGERIVPVNSLEDAGKYLADIKSRRIASDQIGDAYISTVFLVLDHGFDQKRPPVLFETMIFECNLYDGWCHRSCTYEEAQATHKEAVDMVSNWYNSIKEKEVYESGK